MDSLRGSFLVAGCRLRDPSFFKTAVLVIEHTAEGSMGLVVNRPSSVTVSSALSGTFELPETSEMVHVGGPVEPQALFILHSAAEMDRDEQPVLPGLYVASSAEVFEQVVRSLSSQADELRFRVFCGCAGWGPGQLEGELSRGDWFVLPASANLVFHPDPYVIWDTLLGEVYKSKRLLPVECDHPEWN
jgi:putative transcriptional regulator